MARNPVEEDVSVNALINRYAGDLYLRQTWELHVRKALGITETRT
jgi:hypothetical protein